MTADLPVLGPRDNVDRPAQWPLVSHKVLGVGAVSDYVDDTVATPESLEAKVSYVQTIGPLVRVEVIHQGELVEVELTRERQQVLGLVHLKDVFLAQQDGRAIARMLAATSLARQPDHRAWLADSALPTLWLCGARDQKFSALACQLARDCPRLAADQIAHAGHNVHRDAPEAMAARLQAWLRQQPLFSTLF